MRYSKLLSLGSVVLTAFTVSISNAGAHNPDKYANVPFIVPGNYLTNDPGVSSGFVNSGGQSVLRVVANGEGDSGFKVYASVPGSSEGAYTNVFNTPSQMGPFSQGIITFNISGLPSSGTVSYDVSYTTAQTARQATISNGLVTIPANAGTSRCRSSMDRSVLHQ